MKTLVVGATGATGKLLIEQLLNRRHSVKAVVRSSEKLPNSLRENPSISIVEASILEINRNDMIEHLKDCSAVASCLGHNLSFKGLFGSPRRLVADATQQLCDALKVIASEQPFKFVLMNTTGNSNRDLNETVSFAQRCVVALLRMANPPHADNEAAADYLRTSIGQHDQQIEWVVVRPDSLTDEDTVTDYELHASPTRSAIFDAGKTSRINVADFMADLITESRTWAEWKGQMPVIYNKD